MSEIVFMGLDWIQLVVLLMIPICFALAIYLGVTARNGD